MKTYSTSIVAIMLLLSCGGSKQTTDMTSDKMNEESFNKEVSISMIKGACFGQCPVYYLRIDSVGLAHFDGLNFTTKDGKHIKKLDDAKYKSIKRAFISANLFQFDDEYASNVPDLPSTKLVYVEDGKKKTILGKMNKPEKVMALEKMLHELAMSREGWEKVEEPEDMNIYSEIIIEPTSGVRLPTFLKEMKEKYGMRLIKRVSPSTNYWLITYDTKSHDAEAVMKTLMADTRIKTAEFNKKLEIRDR